MKHRNKKVETEASEQNYPVPTFKEPSRVYRDISAQIIKRKINEVYLRTEGFEGEYIED